MTSSEFTEDDIKRFCIKNAVSVCKKINRTEFMKQAMHSNESYIILMKKQLFMVLHHPLTDTWHIVLQSRHATALNMHTTERLGVFIACQDKNIDFCIRNKHRVNKKGRFREFAIFRIRKRDDLAFNKRLLTKFSDRVVQIYSIADSAYK